MRRSKEGRGKRLGKGDVTTSNYVSSEGEYIPGKARAFSDGILW